MAINLEEMRKKFRESENRNLGFETYRPTYGKSKNAPGFSRVKLFSYPPIGEGLTEVGKRVIKHYGLGPENKNQVICPKTLGPGKKCLICDHIAEETNSGDPVRAAKAADHKQSERYQMFVADWDLFEKEDKKVVAIYDSSAYINRTIKQMMLAEWGDFTDWTSNLLKFVCFATGQNSPPKIEIQGVPTEVTLDPEEWLPLFPEWDKILQPSTDAYMHQLLYGVEEEEDKKAVEEKQEVVEVNSPEPESVHEKAPEVEKKTPSKPVTTPASTTPPKGSSKLQDLLNKHRKGA
jgi:hypothetical protein